MFLYEKIAVQIHFMFSFFMTVSLNSGFLFGEPSQRAGCERMMFLGNWISSPWCQKRSRVPRVLSKQERNSDSVEMRFLKTREEVLYGNT